MDHRHPSTPRGQNPPGPCRAIHQIDLCLQAELGRIRLLGAHVGVARGAPAAATSRGRGGGARASARTSRAAAKRARSSSSDDESGREDGW